ncbi:hypothetical protein TruAng_004398 [Truncatella angustata]|nr:hypothetical protein TruAng_004398 [Truncatella angustata]
MWILPVGTLSLLVLANFAPVLAANRRHFEERSGVTYNVFVHHDTNSTVSYVKNSGICETTPGVNTYSGYVQTGENMNMWFWFFESRNNPQTDPVVAWFNGGPGCSSMQAVFREDGPCEFVGDATEPTLNKNSWNNVANMLYIDQPIGVGFSYGTNAVNSTWTAAPYVWILLQAFFSEFPQYESRDFAIFTESYGGMYGPEFSRYIQEKNGEIENGTISGTKIDLVALGINNGWFDEVVSEQAYIDFGLRNKYRQLINSTYAAQLQVELDEVCTPAVQNCTLLQTNAACTAASSSCSISSAVREVAPNFSTYDVRANSSSDPGQPPPNFRAYLYRSDIQAAIGAQNNYTQCISAGFGVTGDGARSMLPTLGEILATGVQVLLWAGDADYTCNYLGNYQAANALEWDGQTGFNSAELIPYTVNGVEKGLFKTVDNLSWLQVYDAGHQIPFYQPELSLQVFNQTIQKRAITST